MMMSLLLFLAVRSFAVSFCVWFFSSHFVPFYYLFSFGSFMFCCCRNTWSFIVYYLLFKFMVFLLLLFSNASSPLPTYILASGSGRSELCCSSCLVMPLSMSWACTDCWSQDEGRITTCRCLFWICFHVPVLDLFAFLGDCNWDL